MKAPTKKQRLAFILSFVLAAVLIPGVISALPTADAAIGDTFGGYAVQQVLSGPATIAATGVYEVPAGHNDIIEVNSGLTDVVLILRGVNETGATSHLQINGTAIVTLYLENGTTNKFTCTGTSTAIDAIQAGIYVASGATLIIEGTGTLEANGGVASAAIGGINNGNPCGTVHIKSGTVIAVAGTGGAGTGGGPGANGGTIIIDGGTVDCTSTNGAGIGGGQSGTSGKITINGGTVTSLTSSGGSGIGGGAGHIASELASDVITITGGVIHSKTTGGGTGIGAGSSSFCGTVNISGGSITALGSSQAAGIGNGVNAKGGVINISGGIIYAQNTMTAAVSGVGGGGSGGTATVNIWSGSVFSVSSDGTKVRINADIDVLPIPPGAKNGPVLGDRLVYMIGVKLVDEHGTVLPLSDISVEVTGGTPYTYATTTNASGMAYLWLPAGTYDYFLYNPNSGTYYDGSMTVGVPADPSEYPISLNTTTMTLSSNYPDATLTASPTGKLYSNSTLPDIALDILHNNPGTYQGKAIAEVKWFRESVENPIYAQNKSSFDTGYAAALPGNKGVGGLGEILDLISVGVDPLNEHHYLMEADKNGRYWFQIHYVSANIGQDVYDVQYVDIENIYTVYDISERGPIGGTSSYLYGPAGAYEPISGGPRGVPFDLNGTTVLTAPPNGFDSFTLAARTAYVSANWDVKLNDGTVVAAGGTSMPVLVTMNAAFMTNLYCDSGNLEQYSLTHNKDFGVTLTVNLDGSPYATHSKTFTLRQSGVVKATGTGGSTVTFSAVSNGTYEIYDGATDTGKTVAIIDGPGSQTLDYYTLSLTPGTGISSVTGAGIYLGGTTVNIGAAVTGGYTWSQWADVDQTGFGNRTAKNLSFSMPAYQLRLMATATKTDTVTYVTVTGIVTLSTDGSPINDVTITYTVNGTQRTTVTDPNGRYTISANAGSVIAITDVSKSGYTLVTPMPSAFTSSASCNFVMSLSKFVVDVETISEEKGHFEYMINDDGIWIPLTYDPLLDKYMIYDVGTGASIKIRATANDEGYDVVWIDGQQIKAPDGIITITVTADRHLEVMFNEKENNSLLLYAMAVLLSAAALSSLLWYVFFYIRTFEVVMGSGMTEKKKAHRKKAYTFAVGGAGYHGVVSYHIGEEGEWKILVPNEDGSYTIPKKDVIGKIMIEHR